MGGKLSGFHCTGSVDEREDSEMDDQLLDTKLSTAI